LDFKCSFLRIIDSKPYTHYGSHLPECSSGGRCLSVEYTDRVGDLAKRHGLKLHIDGARIFNASVVRTFVSYVLLKVFIIIMGKLYWGESCSDFPICHPNTEGWS